MAVVIIEYKLRIQEFFAGVEKLKATDLARYVCHRRAILAFLKTQLCLEDDGKYPKEDRIHNIVFPMGKSSDEITFAEHNLWLVDERFVYHQFLSSDQPIRAIPLLQNDSQGEPDIIMFDKACAFSASSDSPFSSVTIIEFKRPMRSGYGSNDNPFVQVRKYIEAIREGRARTPDGRDVPILEGTPFYCYIVCDIHDSLEKQAFDFELYPTPDGQGFFGYKRQYNAYFEVISYTKMVGDAQKRNAAFFEKLGLPHRAS